MVLLLASLLTASAQEPQLTVETFNAGLAHGFVDHAKARRPHIALALDTAGADVVCLQEVWEKGDRKAIGKALDRYPYVLREPITQTRSARAPACKKKEIFGDDKFVGCLSNQCGDVTGDDRTDCITSQCGPVLDELKTSNPDCAAALMAQVGKSALGAILTITSPFKKAGVYAYKGSNGLMMVSQRELIEPGVLDFSEISTLNRRQALYADINLDGGEQVRVYCTHLTADLSKLAPYPGGFPSWGDENAAQVEALINHAAKADKPTVLMGDFNCGYQNDEVNHFGELEDSCTMFSDAGYVSAALTLDEPPCTWCADNLLNQEEGEHDNSLIDHIFLRGLLPVEQGRRYDQTVEVKAKGGPKPVSLSDHFGYGAGVVIGEPEPEDAPEPAPDDAPEPEAAPEPTGAEAPE